MSVELLGLRGWTGKDVSDGSEGGFDGRDLRSILQNVGVVLLQQIHRLLWGSFPETRECVGRVANGRGRSQTVSLRDNYVKSIYSSYVPSVFL